LKLAEDLRADDKRRFMFHVIRGQALFGQEKYEEAAADLEQANRAYNSDTAVLNVLGRCYQKLGRKADALAAFNASLKLNPEQPEIKRIVAEIGKVPPAHPNY
jgi:Flp pilus assembly protein TadD